MEAMNGAEDKRYNNDEEATPAEMQSVVWTVISILVFFVVIIALATVIIL
jgi:hypothetical protein